MILRSDDGTKIENPSWDEITAIIRGVSARPDSFVTLAQSKYKFIQFAKMSTGGFVMEYREDRSHPLISSARKDLSGKELTEICKEYFTGGTQWKSRIEWKINTLDSIPSWANTLEKIGIAAMIVIGALFFPLKDKLIGPNVQMRWFEVYVALLCYATTASSIKERFMPRRLVWGRRFFWPSLGLAIVMTIAAILG
jgi:hypothetical protein